MNDDEATEARLREHYDCEILKFFAFTHLREPLRNVSRPIAHLALAIVDTIPKSAERTAGLRKLLEAKDCFVRAALE